MSPSTTSSSSSSWFKWMGLFLRFVLIDLVLMTIFALLVIVVVLHKIHDNYLYPEVRLMMFEADERQYTDTTYYHRYCTQEDFSAKSVSELMIPDDGVDFSTQDCIDHMLTHGVSVYPNLVSNRTASILREWIVQQNQIQKGWYVIENDNRYSWGIDMNMHPTLQTFWKELASNKRFVDGLEGIVGKDPAVIEFTAITSSFGATDQRLHADVVPEGSATKFARSFVPSYSLFIPLQDTTHEMGATHVCPGSHVCSSGAKQNCPPSNLAISGPKGEGGVWKMGYGALMNQQTYHKGMGFTQQGALDRVLLIATFAPRPNYRRYGGVETRMIGRGGSYSLLWHQWGHTFSDYVHADIRMTEPQKTLRSLGIVKGNGITFISSASMRMSSEEPGMSEDDLEFFLDSGGFSFLPKSWQGTFGQKSDVCEWHSFLLGTLKKTEQELMKINMIVLGLYLVIVVLLQDVFGKKKELSKGSKLLGSLFRLFITHGLIIFIAGMALKEVEDSHWAKPIRTGKAYRIPWSEEEKPPMSTIPYRTDILFAPHYASDYLASYSRFVEIAHPGNRYWIEVTKGYSAGYASLPPNLQINFCGALIDWTTTDRRFLKQDSERYWSKMVDNDELTSFCHRRLKTASNPLLDTLLRQIDALQSETEFGLFREMAMNTETIPSYLKWWKDRLLPPLKKEHEDSLKKFNLSRSVRMRAAAFCHLFFPRTTLHRKPPTLRDSIAHRFHSFLPPKPVAKEPFPNVWLQEGDKVEAKYNCKENAAWYPGKISSANPNEACFDIKYDDGDEDLSLPPKCVQRASGFISPRPM